MKVSAIILAGGRATRMNGLDKGLIRLDKKPLVQHVIERITPQVEELLLNANREFAQYEKFNLPILQDDHPDFIGPLAGFSLGLKYSKHDYLLTLPCDSPLIPDDLVTRLMNTLIEQDADIAVTKSGGFIHPVFCLMKKSVLPSLTIYLKQGERRVSAWQKSQKYTEVDFNDCDDAFVNVNTFEELEALALKSGNE